MDLRDQKYYKRHNFQAQPMTETEVNEAYRRRFRTYQEVDDYLQMLKKDPHPQKCGLWGRIITIPTVMERRLIETHDKDKLSWLNPDSFDPQPSNLNIIPFNHFIPSKDYIPGYPMPNARGVICQKQTSNYFPFYLEIHRNGCIEYGRDFSAPLLDPNTKQTVSALSSAQFCLALIHTLQFANEVYSRYNYFGDVKLMVILKQRNAIWLQLLNSSKDLVTSHEDHILVTREFPITVLEDEYSWIAASIMHEIFNHFGVWRCDFFDEKGNYLTNVLSKGIRE